MTLLFCEIGKVAKIEVERIHLFLLLQRLAGEVVECERQCREAEDGDVIIVEESVREVEKVAVVVVSGFDGFEGDADEAGDAAGGDKA